MTTPLRKLRAVEERERLEASLHRSRAIKNAAGTLRAPVLVSLAGGIGGYESARPGPGKAPLRGSRGSAAYHLRRESHAEMRRACQHLARNDLAARVILKMAIALVIGDGAILKATTANKAWNTRAGDRFTAWANGELAHEGDHPDCAGRRSLWSICRLIFKAWATDGDLLAIRLGEAAGRAKGSIQLVEGERLQNPSGLAAFAPGFHDGVQVDQYQRPVAYHVAHWSVAGNSVSITTTPVSAADADLLANEQDDTVGMVRGEPAMQAMRPMLDLLARYTENHAVAAYVQTLVAMWIESNDSGQLQAALESTSTEPAQPGGLGEVKMEPGAIYTGNPGEKMSAFSPTAPNINYRDYVWCILVMAAAEMAVPASYAFFDVEGSSYITERAKGAVAGRRHWIPQEAISVWLRKIYVWKIEQWMDAGKLPRSAEFRQCSIHWPKPPVFHLAEEVKGLVEAVNNNLITKDEAIQGLGGKDIQTQIRLRGEEIALEKEHGATPADKPGAARPNEAGPVSGASPDDARPEGGTSPRESRRYRTGSARPRE